ncbi:MAG TPA: GNAT family N-acetyltransferase [Candidatus Latescibacteria bacterium]|jgi:hypothetical protein|nr:hypothetical protein [Gemmatimonadaceae bacterium]MDP6015222.1 GNAT family N-acetyltransferase [Candidatus Latescibacterota bacterium]HJP30482.1 GNAT family N-acetyltransferase [Candidatus Latescibacterota bacterium]
MDIIEYDSSDSFLQRAAPVLARNEAFTGLIYGVADRIGRISDPDEEVEPPFLASVEQNGDVLLIAVMTPPHRLILHAREDTPDADALRALVSHLRASSRSTPGVLGPRPLSESFADTWTRLSGQQIGQGLAMTVYELRKLHPHDGAPGVFRHATDADRELLQTWSDAFHLEVHGHPAVGQEVRAVSRRLPNGNYRIWEDGGRPVSFAARSRPTPTGLAINAVYTPAEFRGHGYATSCVAALCDEILTSGRQFCTLFADVENPTSNSIYQRLGFLALGEFVEFDFE